MRLSFPAFHAGLIVSLMGGAAVGTGAPAAALPAAPVAAVPVATPAAVAQARPVATSTPDPLEWSGKFRSYYFTRQNASNNPGAQFNFTPGAKYSTTGVNQASWNSAIDLHAEYAIPDMGGVFIGGSYLYADPLDGPCSVAYPEHIKGQPCVSQRPPNTNPDDTLPGFTLDTFYEAYLGYRSHGWYAKVGDQLFTSPWANPADSRMKPAAFQGADVVFSGAKNWTFEAADMIQFQNRTSNTFNSTTLITSYPSGYTGLPANINVPGGNFIQTNGFFFAKAGYANAATGLSVDGYFYSVSDLANMLWFDGKYAFNSRMKPFIELQGGTESNAGASYVGKIDSQVFGARIGANVTKNLVLTFGFDTLPWHNETIVLPKGASCSNATNQLTTKGVTVPYFLPSLNNGTGQCTSNADGTTTLYYGGWASPYTDNYTSDPFFTTNGSQGMVQRRSAGTSERLALTYTSSNNRIVFLAAYGWLNYGNGAAPVANTNEYDLDGIYRFNRYSGKGPYRGLMLRDRYFVRSLGNTYCGAAATACPAGSVYGSQYLGGLPLFKYNRAMLEYDF